MHVYKRLNAAFLVLLTPLFLMAQQTQSPYSRFGYGVLDHATFGHAKGMGGVGIGIRDNNMINASNPASFSAVDTMTMLFDFGLNTSTSLFRQGSASKSATNGGVDYVSMKIPLKSWWGVSAGLYPLTKVGYSYTFNNVLSNGDTYTGTYTGTGGLNAVFLGTGIKLGDRLGLGASFKYISGQITQTSFEAFDRVDVRDISVSESWYLNGSSFDLGVQYKQPINTRNELVLGATFSGNATLNNEVYRISVSTDTSSSNATSRFSLPRFIGVGASWIFDERLTLALDVNRQYWSDAYLNGAVDSLSDMTRVSFGLEYLPSFVSSRYYKAIKYRFGGYYSDSYIKNDMGNIRNLGITLGFGLPLNLNSALNVAFELGKVIPPAPSLISETYFKVSLAMTFNETWFFKRKL